MNDFIEVSAVITHPEYLGKGYKTVGSAYRKYNFNQNKPLSYMYMKKLWSYQALKIRVETRRKISFGTSQKK
jgi:hypothetical protein